MTSDVFGHAAQQEPLDDAEAPRADHDQIFETLSPSDTLQRAMDHVIAGFQQDLPVLEGDRLVGVLTRADLMKGLTDKGREASVADAMTARFDTAEASEMVEGAFQRLRLSGCPALPVLQRDRLVGVLTPDNVGEFLMIEAALRGDRKKVSAGAPRSRTFATTPSSGGSSR